MVALSTVETQPTLENQPAGPDQTQKKPKASLGIVTQALLACPLLFVGLHGLFVWDGQI